MNTAVPTSEPSKPRRKNLWRRHAIGSLLMSLILTSMLTLVIFLMLGFSVSAPDWARSQIQERANAALGVANLQFDKLDFIVEEGIKPGIRLTNVQIVTDNDAEILAFAEVRAGLSLPALLRGGVQPNDISVTGVFARLRREVDGSVVLSGALDLTAPSQQAATFVELIEKIDAILTLPALSELTYASVQALTLQIEDVRSARTWTIDGGRIRLNRNGDSVRLTSDLALLSGGQGVATLEANYAGTIGSVESEFGITVDDVPATDIAAWAAPFAWLEVLRAPISGAMRGGIAKDASLRPLNATLAIGEGVVQPTDATRPVPFTSARSYFSYDPVSGILTFDELSIDSAWFTGRTEGQAVLGLSDTGQLEDFVGQFQTSMLTTNPDNLYDIPIEIDSAQMDFRLRLAPFRFDVGQVLLRDQGQSLWARGALTAEPEGWSYSIDAQMDGLSQDRLLALWPERIAQRSRAWLVKNVLSGELQDLDAAVRGGPNTSVKTYASFSYANADVRFMRDLPPITGARGTASLLENRFVVSLDDGQVAAPQGGIVKVAGSSFIVPDVTVRPDGPAVVRLEAQGTVTAALSLLDQPPLSIMTKAGLPPDLATGRLRLAGNLAFPLKKGLKAPDVVFDVSGIASALDSTKLIKGRRLAADSLRVIASDEQVQVSGSGTLEGVPFNARWAQPISSTPQPGTVTGTIELSERTIEAFNLGLPTEMVTGQGSGAITITLPVNKEAPTLNFDTDLLGLRLSSPPLGWSKPATAAGSLKVQAVLGDSPRIDQLSLDAPGLSATGTVSLTKDNLLERASFDKVRLGNWLSGAVDIVGRGEGKAPEVVVRGGTIDLRQADFGGDASVQSQTGGGSPLTLTLDKLQVTDTIALTGVQGNFSLARGLDGAFTARVNGDAPIRGKVLPLRGRSAIQITSDDAGGVAASAGILKQARGGALSVTLLPVGSASFDGTLNVAKTRIKDAPAIAALLNAISVVGLLEQMDGGGIHFNDVEAAFRLTPKTMVVTRASAVGPSIGLSMEGTYDVEGSVLDMRGVVSPLYLINGIGSLFARKGEGLIGFNYRLSGPTSEPRVSINPLSALTPGLLRGIFRAPGPEVPQADGKNGPAAIPEVFVPQPLGNTREQLRLKERQQAIDER